MEVILVSAWVTEVILVSAWVMEVILVSAWVMEVILVSAWVTEVILVSAWVMEVIHSIIMDTVAILFITGTVVNLKNGFNPCSDVFRGFKLSLKGF
jgi:hypothetical protein